MTTASDPKRHEIDVLKLEAEITDLEGDVLLLHLAIEDLDRATVDFAMPPPGSGYVHLLLTREQLRALHHAAARISQDVRSVAVAAMGPEWCE